jgi:hypothetical protein
VTVVIAAWNEQDAIEATLERLADTSYPGRVGQTARLRTLLLWLTQPRRGGSSVTCYTALGPLPPSPRFRPSVVMEPVWRPDRQRGGEDRVGR